jgi:predicted Zn-dependent peptidase
MKKTVYKNPLLGEYTVALFDNGLTAYIMEKKDFSSVYAAFGTKYGSIDTKFSRNDGPEISVPEGIAHFLEHKLFESEDGDAFSRFAETGAYCNAYTSFDRTCYIFSCSTNFEKNFEILLDFVQSPYFTAETVKKEQGIIGQEIKMYEDSPGWRVLFNLLGQMYENHPVKIDIAGTVESIAQIDDKLLYECYNTFYNPSNMYVCVAGNVKTDEVLAQIEKGMKPSERVKVSRADFGETEKVLSHYVEQTLAVAKPMFVLGFKEVFENGGPSVKDRIVAGLMLELLSGDCSSLYRSLVDSGLIGDEFSAEYFQGSGYSAFLIDGESDDPEAVAQAIKKEIKRLITEGIDRELLTAIKRSAYGDAVKRFDSNEAIVTDMIDCAVSGGDLFDTVEILKEITAEDVEKRLHSLKEELSVLSVIKPAKGKNANV